MSLMDQDGGRVVALHPIFTLRRIVRAQEIDDLSLVCRDIQSFVSAHGDQNLIARSDENLIEHMQRSELVLLYEGPHAARNLIGVCVCVIDDNAGVNGGTADAIAAGAMNDNADITAEEKSPTFELAYTAINTNFRGRGLACLTASAALVGHLMNYETSDSIVLACRPSNMACRQAALKLGVDFRTASDLHSAFPHLKSHVEYHRRHHEVRNWTEEPLLGLVQPKAVQDGARNLLGADTPNGLAWPRGGRVFLEGEWNMSRERDATRQHLMEMAEGRTPRFRPLDNPPPAPGVGRCA